MTNEGTRKVDDCYFNIEYRVYAKPLPADTLYFHAQYRQATPNHGSTSQWHSNGDPNVDKKPNLTGQVTSFALRPRGVGTM